jgi:hypothetical protein
MQKNLLRLSPTALRRIHPQHAMLGRCTLRHRKRTGASRSRHLPVSAIFQRPPSSTTMVSVTSPFDEARVRTT